MVNHPNFEELREFWKTGKFDRSLVLVQNHAVNVAIAMKKDTSLDIVNLLLELNPDHPEKKDEKYLSGKEADHISVRFALAKFTSHREIIELLAKDSRESVADIAKERLENEK